MRLFFFWYFQRLAKGCEKLLIYFIGLHVIGRKILQVIYSEKNILVTLVTSTFNPGDSGWQYPGKEEKL